MIIFDLDDTLRTTDQSSHLIPADPSRTENWLAWQDHVVNNGVGIEEGIRLYLMYKYGLVTIILTSSQFGTQQWLEMNELPLPDQIFERHPNDHSTPFEFKKRFIDENHGNITLWIDDHTEVCDYAESRGITVIRV
ncbi:hypothetical protein [Vibrio phage Artemius]|nr:hypothetical protein [Vibrio phage Artemius]